MATNDHLIRIIEEIPVIAERAIGSRPSYDEWFMAHAIVASSRATCVRNRCGAVISYDNRIVAEGYNGPVAGEPNCVEVGCAKERAGLEYQTSLNTGTCQAVHAEANALSNTLMNLRMLPGNFSIYTTILPCNACTRLLLAYPNLGRVVFMNPYLAEEVERSVDLLKRRGVKLERLPLSFERYLDISMGQAKQNIDVWSIRDRDRAKGIK